METTDTAIEMRRIIIVSDATGETASTMISAAMVQFGGTQGVNLSRYKNIREESQIDAIVEEAQSNHELIVYTLVNPQLRAHCQRQCRKHSVPCVDILGPLLSGLSAYLGHEPKMTAGLLRGVNERYFQRIEAMEYTIAHDDGREVENLKEADLIILGISRTSKTPLSMYLSHQGWRVANIPLIQGFEVPQGVLDCDQKKIICLTIDPDELVTIRRARLQRLGSNRGGDYADPEKVTSEVDYANSIFRKNRRWPVFNVTGKALEETASEIIKLMNARKLIPTHLQEYAIEDRIPGASHE